MSPGAATPAVAQGAACSSAGAPGETPVAAAGSSHSRFVQRIRRRYAAELPLLPAGLPTRESLQSTFDALAARGHALGTALRILRQLVLERLATLDCEQQAPLAGVTRSVTLLAEFALDAACRQAMSELSESMARPCGPTAGRRTCG